MAKKFSDLREVATVPAGGYVIGYDPTYVGAESKNFRIGTGKLGGSTGGVTQEQFFDLIELLSTTSNKIVQGRTYYADTFATNTGINFTASKEVLHDSTNKKITPNAKDTSVLLHFDGADKSTTITDENGHVMTINSGNGFTYIVTGFKKFGTGSLQLTNNGYIKSPNSIDFGVGTGDFTVEAFVMNADTFGTVGGTLFDSRIFNTTTGVSTGVGFNVSLFNSGGGPHRVRFTSGGVPAIVLETAAVVDSNGVWVNIAVVRKSGVVTIYVNGVVAASGACTTDLGSTAAFYLGTDANTSNNLGGKVDEFRFVKKAVRDGAYTVPTAAFTVQPASPKFTLVSAPWTAPTSPNTIGLRILARALVGIANEPVLTPNVDLVASVSRDGGTTWTNVTLTADYTMADGYIVLTSPLTSVTGPAGTQIAYKLDVPTVRFIEVTSVTEYLG